MKYKKSMLVILAVVSVFGLSACGGGGDDDYYYEPELVTLFLVDEQGFSYGGIPYKCDSMLYWSETLDNGEFTFLPPDNCEFDFYGLNGTDPDDGYTNHLIYIVDYLDNGKNGIPYECANFNAGFLNETYDDGIYDGSFDYDIDDQCVFYL